MALTLLLLLLLLLAANPLSTTGSTTFSTSLPVQQLTEKMTHLHFYFHNTLSGPKPTAIRIVAPPFPTLSSLGLITIMDNPLTSGPEPTSELIGRAQGMYVAAAQEEVVFLMVMNLAFTVGEYNGSVLTVLGRNPLKHKVREMSVVGGSGLFRFVRGFALAQTYRFDEETLDAVVEYNVTVIHS